MEISALMEEVELEGAMVIPVPHLYMGVIKLVCYLLSPRPDVRVINRLYLRELAITDTGLTKSPACSFLISQTLS
ncbi:hypothetical protein NQ315_011582 [Exocentrus adspersus]|uniref:Uncharacterized protein n=1 Tax=Exocentrus adspersus TaxID=1586481 RepID=A0AAV8VW27_9CUCU|nr:hypothetical protein NQ315_011582 [Exocentrus adspersus]